MHAFSLDVEETQKYLAWEAAHHTKQNCKFFDDGKSPICPVGAIGGRVSFRFTITGVGVIVVVECACGDKKDLTNYDLW